MQDSLVARPPGSRGSPLPDSHALYFRKITIISPKLCVQISLNINSCPVASRSKSCIRKTPRGLAIVKLPAHHRHFPVGPSFPRCQSPKAPAIIQQGCGRCTETSFACHVLAGRIVGNHWPAGRPTPRWTSRKIFGARRNFARLREGVLIVPGSLRVETACGIFGMMRVPRCDFRALLHVRVGGI